MEFTLLAANVPAFKREGDVTDDHRRDGIGHASHGDLYSSSVRLFEIKNKLL